MSNQSKTAKQLMEELSGKLEVLTNYNAQNNKEKSAIELKDFLHSIAQQAKEIYMTAGCLNPVIIAVTSRGLEVYELNFRNEIEKRASIKMHAEHLCKYHCVMYAFVSEAWAVDTKFDGLPEEYLKQHGSINADKNKKDIVLIYATDIYGNKCANIYDIDDHRLKEHNIFECENNMMINMFEGIFSWHTSLENM